MISVWIDPSYTGTGVAVFKEDVKELNFALFSRAETKRSLINYFNAADSLTKQLKHFLLGFQPDQVFMEYPPPTSQSSAGLYGLQYLYLQMLREFNVPIYGIPPKFLKSSVVKHLGSDSISNRKKFTNELIVQYINSGWKVPELKLLKLAGCDIHTAFLFKYFTDLSGKVWPMYEFV